MGGASTSASSGVVVPFDPLDVPALAAGAVYLPGEGVEPIAGTDDTLWHSLAAEVNDASDAHTGHKPVLATAANGAQYWDLAAGGLYSSWVVDLPGAAYTWTDKGTYAVWVYLAQNDDKAHIAFAQWPEVMTQGNRVYCQKNIDFTRAAVYLSRDGFSMDNFNGLDGIGDRSKWNSAWGPDIEPLIDWTGWHFIRVSFDMSAENYYCPGGGTLCSQKMRFYFDEVYYEGMYSAPHPQWGGAPPDGPVRAIYPSTYPFSWGADFAANHFDAIGPAYVARGDEGLSDEVWLQVMAYRAPTGLP